MSKNILTIGEVADQLGCQAWKIRRVIRDGLLPEPDRLGTYRVFLASDIPRVRAALKTAGYLK